MPGSSGVNAINRQKFLAELAKLLTFMYEEDRRYALEMYERMFDIAEDNEQWLLQNLMSPTRQAVIIARSYDAKERKLSVEAEWREDEEEDPGSETPPFVLAINKIFDDLFPDEEELEEAVDTLDASFDPDTARKKEAKRPKMPKAAVLLDRTQEFESVTDSVIEGMDLIDSTEEADREEEWTDRTALEEDEREPDPRVQILDRTEVYDSAEDEAAYTTRRLSYVYEGTNMFVVSEGAVTEAVDNPSVYWRFYKKDAIDFAYKLVLTSPGYLDATRGVFLYFVVEALVCFTFSFSIFYVLLPLTAFRRGRRTLGKAVLKVGYLGADALNPSWKRYACYCLFLYGDIYLGSVVSFLIPIIVSVSMAFLSQRRQDLAEYVTNIYLVDNRSQEIYLDYGDYVVHTDERENATLENPDLRTKP